MVDMFVYGQLRSGDWHEKGGGFVEDSATADPNAYIGPMVRVIDSAQIIGAGTRLEDQVIVCGSAIVTNANVGGHAVIRDSAQVTGGRVAGYSVIRDTAIVTNSTILGNSVIRRDAVVTGETMGYYDSEPCDTGCDVEDNNI